MNFLELEHNGEWVRLWAERRGVEIWVHFNGKSFVYEETGSKKVSSQKTRLGSGMILAPMPGKIIKVHVREGERVQVGQVTVVMEAMKMEYRLCAEISGQIEKLSCVQGSQVALGQELVVIRDKK